MTDRRLNDTVMPLRSALQNGDRFYVLGQDGVSYYCTPLQLLSAFGSVDLGALNDKVDGPSSVTDGNPAVFDGLTGTLIKQVTFSAFKTSLGLGNVDNTSDVAKRVGTVLADDAPAGSIGEMIQSILLSASGVSLTTDTAKTVTSIALTAGDWDVRGLVGFSGGSTTTVGAFAASSSTTDNSLSAAEHVICSGWMNNQTVFANADIRLPIPQRRITTAAPLTVYLVAQLGFGTSTAKAYGRIEARRVR